MKIKHQKYIRALLALSSHNPAHLDHEEIATALSPEACNELADHLMLLQVFLEGFENALRAAAQAGIQVKGIGK